MASLNFQFHGTQEEVLQMAIGWAKNFDLSVSFEKFFPDYFVDLIEEKDMGRLGLEVGNIRRIALSLNRIEIDATSPIEFLDKNPDCFVLTLGQANENELRESSATAMTNDDESLSTWKKIIRQAKSEMKKGACVFNPANNVRVVAKNHWYTKGALELANAGVKMLAAAGWVEYEFDT